MINKLFLPPRNQELRMDFGNLMATNMSLNAIQNMTFQQMLQIACAYVFYQALSVLRTDILPLCKQRIEAYWEDKKNTIISTPVPEVISEILFHYDDSSNKEYIDAIIAHLCGINNVKCLRFDKFFMMNQYNDFTITADIYGKLVSMKTGPEALIVFKIYSKTIPLSQLKQWADEVVGQYVSRKKNQYAGTQYYFDQDVSNDNVANFRATPFYSTKNLSNLYGERIEDIRFRVDKFLNNREWYSKNGIPYTLGFLFKGSPGCGKTSCIKAIANESKRHIFNIKLHDKTKVSVLKKMFFSDMVSVINANGQVETISIPVGDRIYVMEDVDCSTTFMLKREFKKTEEAEGADGKKMTNEEKNNKKKYDEMMAKKEEYINLGIFLNVLDGILETPGRILILTSNFPEKLDSAVLRPGRVDCLVEFPSCSAYTLDKICQNYFQCALRCAAKYEDKFSPAVVQELVLSSKSAEHFEALLEAGLAQPDQPDESE